MFFCRFDLYLLGVYVEYYSKIARLWQSVEERGRLHNHELSSGGARATKKCPLISSVTFGPASLAYPACICLTSGLGREGGGNVGHCCVGCSAERWAREMKMRAR